MVEIGWTLFDLRELKRLILLKLDNSQVITSFKRNLAGYLKQIKNIITNLDEDLLNL